MPASKIRLRVCQECGKEYELGKDSTQHKYCSIPCRARFHNNNGGRKYRSSDKGKESARRWRLLSNFGITLETFNSLLTSQNNSCAICGTTNPGGYNWHVDHCHTTNKVRGILCSACNQGLGLFYDNKTTLQNAITYLENSTK